MYKRLFTLFLLLFLITNVFAWCSGTDCNTDWEYKQELTLNTEGVLTSDVTNEHAILVHVDSSNTDFWINSEILNDVNDVRFTNYDDSIDLNYHFESIDTDTNDLWAWVRVQSFDADANTIINMYYGNPNAIDNQNETGTYPSGYQAVWNLKSINDGTSNNYDLTNTNAISGENCKIGGCYNFNGTDAKMVSANGAGYFGTGDASILFWMDKGTIGTNRIIAQEHINVNTTNGEWAIRGNPSFSEDTYLLVRQYSTNYNSPNADTSVLSGWNQIAFVWDRTNTQLKTFLNNVQTTPATNISVITGDFGDVGKAVSLGSSLQSGGSLYVDVNLDNVIILNYAISEDEISLLYNSENQSLLTFGEQQKKNIGVTADFDYSLNQTTNVLTLTDTSTDANVTINDWNWLVNSSTSGLSNPNAQNPTFSGFISATDYNVSLCVGGLGDDGNTYVDCTSQNINIGIGTGTIKIYDENSETLLNNVTYTISPSINGNSGTTLTDTNTFDLNLQGITNTTYTFTFTKTGYGTRYYITDLNQYSELDINFALLPSTLSTSIPLKVYQTDETTLFTNTFVELYLPSKNDWIVGRQKTDSIGEATFSLHLEDQNYNANIAGIYTYQPVALTILYPKNEITLNQIDENWQIDITQNLYQSFTELNSDKIIYLLPNTANPFNIKISDMNGNYFSRTYAQQYPGNPLTDSLQPYLMPTDEGLLTTITTYNRNNITQSDVTIKIYKYISGLGRTLVEQVITDSKGQALVLLEINDDYEFETYYNGSFIKTYNITATSSNIYIVVDIPEDVTTQTPNYFKTVFTPYNTGLIKANSGTQDFGFIVSNPGESSVNIYAIILQNGINLGDLNDTLTTTTDTFEITINWTDLNIGEAEARIFIITDSNTYVFRQYYQINDSFGTNYDILAGFQTYIRTDFGCEATGVCYPLLAMGILFSIVIVLFASVKVTGIGSNSSGIMFGILMIFFSYLNWIPVEITLGIVLIIAAFIINERRS